MNNFQFENLKFWIVISYESNLHTYIYIYTALLLMAMCMSICTNRLGAFDPVHVVHNSPIFSHNFIRMLHEINLIVHTFNIWLRHFPLSKHTFPLGLDIGLSKWRFGADQVFIERKPIRERTKKRKPQHKANNIIIINSSVRVFMGSDMQNYSDAALFKYSVSTQTAANKIKTFSILIRHIYLCVCNVIKMQRAHFCIDVNCIKILAFIIHFNFCVYM